MIFKILLSRSVQTPNSDKNWQTSCPLQTFVCNISWHLEFITEQGHRVNWVSGSLDSRVTGSLGHRLIKSGISHAGSLSIKTAPTSRDVHGHNYGECEGDVRQASPPSSWYKTFTRWRIDVSSKWRAVTTQNQWCENRLKSIRIAESRLTYIFDSLQSAISYRLSECTDSELSLRASLTAFLFRFLFHSFSHVEWMVTYRQNISWASGRVVKSLPLA